jgi:hypothetical protein
MDAAKVARAAKSVADRSFRLARLAKAKQSAPDTKNRADTPM